MVKLTTKYLFRKISKKNQLQPRRKDESDLDYLNRLTHLYFQSQFIDKIAPIPECQSVTVVYLQNNLLQTIHGLESFPKLTHLYLQHNYISKLENLKYLTSLKKLYLGWNEISVVENLEGLKNLTELHLENQRLPRGETLYFDPRTVSHLSNSLKVLNVSNNNLSSILCLDGFTSLTKLLIDGNQIWDLEDLMETLSCLPLLQELSSEGNPVATDRKYLDAVVVSARSLKVLDGKAIDEQTRTFITNLTNKREQRRKLSELSTKALNSEESMQSNFLENNTRLPEPPQHDFGSKLFPILKKFAKGSEKVVKLDSKGSAKSLSPVFRNSFKVSRVPDSASFYF